MQQTVHHNPNRGTTSADVPALCRREGHAAPGRVQHHHRQQYHAVHLEEGSKGEGGEAAPAQSLHGGQQNRVQGHLQIRLRVSTLAYPIIIVQLLGVGELLLFSEGYVGLM